jgi:hypothetical protein
VGEKRPEVGKAHPAQFPPGVKGSSALAP